MLQHLGYLITVYLSLNVLGLRTCGQQVLPAFKHSLRRGHILWNLHPKMCVDVVAAASDNGNNVQLWDCDSALSSADPEGHT